MSQFVIIAGGAGIACVLAALVGLGMASLSRGHWPTAVACLAGFAAILFVLLAGIEYADTFWEGR